MANHKNTTSNIRLQKNGLPARDRASGEPRRLRRDAKPELIDPWRMTSNDWALLEQWAVEGRARVEPEPSMAELQERARVKIKRKAEKDSAKRRAAAEAERLRRWQASTRGRAAARGATYLELIAAAMEPGQWYGQREIADALPNLSYGGIKYSLMQKGRTLALIERAENSAASPGFNPILVRWGKSEPRFLYRLTAKGEAFRAAFLAKRQGKGPETKEPPEGGSKGV